MRILTNKNYTDNSVTRVDLGNSLLHSRGELPIESRRDPSANVKKKQQCPVRIGNDKDMLPKVRVNLFFHQSPYGLYFSYHSVNTAVPVDWSQFKFFFVTYQLGKWKIFSYNELYKNTEYDIRDIQSMWSIRFGDGLCQDYDSDGFQPICRVGSFDLGGKNGILYTPNYKPVRGLTLSNDGTHLHFTQKFGIACHWAPMGFGNRVSISKPYTIAYDYKIEQSGAITYDVLSMSMKVYPSNSYRRKTTIYH